MRRKLRSGRRSATCPGPCKSCSGSLLPVADFCYYLGVGIEMKACEWCGKEFPVRRAGTRFCWETSRCRTAASRARKKVRAQQEQSKKDALRDTIARVTNRKDVKS